MLVLWTASMSLFDVQKNNYKGTFSVVLLALVDANLRFIAIDVGAPGRNSDGGIFGRCRLDRSIIQDRMNFPAPRPLPGGSDDTVVPFVVVGDGAFPLRSNLMKPFPGLNCPLPQRQYNYRLSRARRTSENTFGTMAEVWRIMHAKMAAQPDKVISIVKAACVMHNYLINNKQHITIDEAVSLSTSINIDDVDFITNAADVRNEFLNYFVNHNPLPWQMNHVQRGEFD